MSQNCTDAAFSYSEPVVLLAGKDLQYLIADTKLHQMGLKLYSGYKICENTGVGSRAQDHIYFEELYCLGGEEDYFEKQEDQGGISFRRDLVEELHNAVQIIWQRTRKVWAIRWVFVALNENFQRSNQT